MYRFRSVLLAAAAVAGVTTLSIMPVSAASRPSSPAPLAPACLRSYNPYSVTKSFLIACRDGVYPLQKVERLPGGGRAYVYDVAGIRTVSTMPPAHFNPLTATAAKLAEYGYPPRPSGGRALRTWTMMMRKAHFVKPSPYMVTDTAAERSMPRPRTGQGGDANATSSIWAGNMATSHTYTNVYTYWLEPHTYSSQCSPTAESTWPGLGGWNHDILAQAGTQVGESGLSAHQSWYELIDGSTNHFVPLSVTATPGGQFIVEVDRTSGGYRIFVENGYTGAAKTVTPSFSGYDGSTAEFIVEDPYGGWANGGPYLSNFKSFEVEDAEASDNGGSVYHGLANWTHDDVVMKSPDDGATMAYAGSAFNSGDSWYDYQSRCY